MAFKYYAVAIGKETGIFDSWFGIDGAQEQIEDSPNARWKGFNSRAAAQDWLNIQGEMSQREYDNLIARLLKGDRTVLKILENEARKRVG